MAGACGAASWKTAALQDGHAEGIHTTVWGDVPLYTTRSIGAEHIGTALPPVRCGQDEPGEDDGRNHLHTSQTQHWETQGHARTGTSQQPEGVWGPLDPTVCNVFIWWCRCQKLSTLTSVSYSIGFRLWVVSECCSWPRLLRPVSLSWWSSWAAARSVLQPHHRPPLRRGHQREPLPQPGTQPTSGYTHTHAERSHSRTLLNAPTMGTESTNQYYSFGDQI